MMTCPKCCKPNATGCEDSKCLAKLSASGDILTAEQRMERDPTFNGVRSHEMFPYVIAERNDLRIALASLRENWNDTLNQCITRPAASEDLPPLPSHPDCEMAWRESEKQAIRTYGALCRATSPAAMPLAGRDLEYIGAIVPGIKPVLYTDVINDKQAMRDNLWLATTEQLNALLAYRHVPVATPPLEQVPGEREQFEAWAISPEANYDLDPEDDNFAREPTGKYVSMLIRNAWHVWQAHAALSIQQQNDDTEVAKLKSELEHWKAEAAAYAKQLRLFTPPTPTVEAGESQSEALKLVRKNENTQVWLAFKGGMVCLNNIAESLGPITRRNMEAALVEFLSATPTAHPATTQQSTDGEADAHPLDTFLTEHEKTLHEVIASLQSKLIEMQKSRHQWKKIAETEAEARLATPPRSRHY